MTRGPEPWATPPARKAGAKLTLFSTVLPEEELTEPTGERRPDFCGIHSPSRWAAVVFCGYMLFGSAVSCVVFGRLAWTTRNHISNKLESDCAGRAQAIKDRIGANVVSANIMAAAMGKVSSLTNLRADYLDGFLNPEDGLPGGFAAARMVQSADRGAWERAANASMSWVPNLVRERAPESSRYLPLQDVVRDLEGRWVVGNDVASDFLDPDLAWKSLAAGGKGGKPVFLELHLRALLEYGGEKGAGGGGEHVRTFMFCPLYDLEPFQRSGSPAGFVVSQLEVSSETTFFTWTDMATDTYHLRDDGGKTLVEDKYRQRADFEPDSRHRVTLNFEDAITHNRWQVVCTPAKGVIRGYAYQVAEAVGGVGISASFCFAIFGAYQMKVTKTMRTEARNALALVDKQRKTMATLSIISSAVIQAIPDPIITLDSNGRITAANDVALSLIGLRQADIEHGVNVSDILTVMDGSREPGGSGDEVGCWISRQPPKPEGSSQVIRIIPAEGGVREVIVMRRNGPSYFAEVTSSRPSEHVGDFHQVIVLRDISEQKTYEASLRSARDEAETAKAEKSRVLLFLCHELRNPLHVLSGGVSLIRAQNMHPELVDELSSLAHVANLMQIIIDDAWNLSLLQKEICEGRRASQLKFALSRTRTQQHARQSVNVVSLVREALAVVGPTAERKRQSLQLITRKSATIMLAESDLAVEMQLEDMQFAMDAPNVRQALLKVLESSIRSTGPDGQIVCRVEADDSIEFRLSTLGRAFASISPIPDCSLATLLQLSVEDTREPPSQEALASLFDPFSSNNSSQGDSFENPGLAMALAKCMVDAMGGNVSVSTVESGKTSQGFTFLVKLTIPLCSVRCHRCNSFACECRSLAFEDESQKAAKSARSLAGVKADKARAIPAPLDLTGEKPKDARVSATGPQAATSSNAPDASGPSAAARESPRPPSALGDGGENARLSSSLSPAMVDSGSEERRQTPSSSRSVSFAAEYGGAGRGIDPAVPQAGGLPPKAAGTSDGGTQTDMASGGPGGYRTRELLDDVNVQESWEESLVEAAAARKTPFVRQNQADLSRAESPTSVVFRPRTPSRQLNSSPDWPNLKQPFSPDDTSHGGSPITSGTAYTNPAAASHGGALQIVDGAGRVVVIAEDNGLVAKIAKKQLERHGYSALLAANGKEAVNVVKQRATKKTSERDRTAASAPPSLDVPISCITMDIQMPELDGIEATKQIRVLGYDGPIIAVTANALQSERDKCFEAGMTAFISKPLKEAALLEIVARHIADFEANNPGPAAGQESS